MSGDVTVISGPTAVGKGTVVRALKARHPAVWVSVSATTRPPRPGEVDGEHYWFVSSAAFDELETSDGLLEWAVVHGRDRYGTPSAPVLDALARGERVILEIDLQGARQVKAKLPQARLVFIAPPDWDELVARLVGRGTETAEQRERRLVTARAELAAADEFDHVVVNDEVGRAVDELVDLLGL
ncbi:guanylate kinase [Micropruina sonneratiae]|uniref:guanylate kinase n=1 Tax=Micropruina sonneratiae TaxID=2986940 RepID=UPI00222779B7|nr:guanylate kinase [Micropruina sp. KQZ13P-5]MCW3157718.1 guanylate kinase [Micropruina sp. KQZ13P-5]